MAQLSMHGTAERGMAGSSTASHGTAESGSTHNGKPTDKLKQAKRIEHSTVDVDTALQAPAHATEAEVRAWYYECNKANAELQAKVSKLQEMVNCLSADGHTAKHRTQDCKVCQHTPWQATHDAAVTELQRRRAIGDSGGGSTLQQPATKAHGKPHSRVAPSNMAEQSTVTTTITINGYEVPHLDERPGLKCCAWQRAPSTSTIAGTTTRTSAMTAAVFATSAWCGGPTSFGSSTTRTTPSSTQARQPSTRLQSCNRLHVAASWHARTGTRPKQLQLSYRHASVGVRHKPSSGSSSMWRGARRQPHSCRHGSANERHSFCCDVYALTWHDLQWR